ncbi:MAG TPA: hypothetical protein PKY25_01765 [Bacilli bacterium]|nr:hypothetical protein [Bacilli bacterium]
MIRKIKEWFTPKGKNKVGRPKLAKKELMKTVKIELAMAFVLCATLLFSFTSVLTGKSPLELLGLSDQNKYFGSVTYQAVTAKTNQFVAADGIDTQNVCHKIYIPTNAGKNWRIHVYYKPYNQNYFSGIVSSTYYQYTNDKSKEVCFKKQKSNKETYRILVKWTTNTSSDIAKGTNGSWKPTGWSYKSDIGWAYKDYTIDWSKVTVSNTTTTTKKVTTSNSTLGTYKVTITPTPTTAIKTVAYGKVMTFQTKFEVSPRQKYYMRWNTYSGNTRVYYGVCETMTNKTISRTLTINNFNRQGIWIIYSDSSCKNEVKKYSTGKYTYNNSASAYYTAASVGSFTASRITVYGYQGGGPQTSCGEKIDDGYVFWDVQNHRTTKTNTGIRVVASSSRYPRGSIIRINIKGRINMDNFSAQLKSSVVDGKIIAVIRDRGVSGDALDLLINSENNLEGWNSNPTNVPIEVLKYGTGCGS